MDAKKKTQHAPGWRPSVLVLDDEWTTLEVIKSSLVNQFAVEIASRADQAVSMMETRHFDVVLSDVRMPDRDGLSLVRELKSRFPETQYILMTAFSDIRGHHQRHPPGRGRLPAQALYHGRGPARPEPLPGAETPAPGGGQPAARARA